MTADSVDQIWFAATEPELAISACGPPNTPFMDLNSPFVHCNSPCVHFNSLLVQLAGRALHLALQVADDTVFDRVVTLPADHLAQGTDRSRCKQHQRPR